MSKKWMTVIILLGIVTVTVTPLTAAATVNNTTTNNNGTLVGIPFELVIMSLSLASLTSHL
jgi:hypothetical protein